MSERYQLWPMAECGGEWSVPDAVLAHVWQEMALSGRYKTVFYDGGVTDLAGFIAWMKSPSNLPVLVADTQEKKIVFVAWLNNLIDPIAFGHFCALGPYIPKCGEMVMKYWSGFMKENGTAPLFQSILGVIPETNKKAIEVAKSVGFKFETVIPKICNLTYKGCRVGGALGYYCPEETEG